MGPEAPGPQHEPSGGYKDRTGAIKRQAARFRVFGVDESGQAIRELTSRDARIEWTAHLANKKAAWYVFNTALDLNFAQPAARRNASYVDGARERLIIDAGARTIKGPNRSGRAYRFDTGSFMRATVDLGEVRTDSHGRLIVLGGYGRSFSPTGAPLSPFFDSDAWCDDIADGFVKAKVILNDGQEFEADPSWVVVTPPNYAPHLQALVTLHDLIEAVVTPRPWSHVKVSFADHILPIFERLVGLQWVNLGFHVEFGWQAPFQLLSNGALARLADPSKASKQLRRVLFNKFRNPDYVETEPQAIPQLYGDYPSLIQPYNPRHWMTVTPLQYDRLRRWADGDFVSDMRRSRRRSIDDYAVRDQPAALDRAALENCLGGPFHPGCEVPWIVRHASLYARPFRVKALPTARQDFGPELTPDAALGEHGPVAGVSPGDITKWLCVPWQIDAVNCRSGYDPSFDRKLPTFWPTILPNHVLTRSEYRKVMNKKLSLRERRAAFEQRRDWLRAVAFKDPAKAAMTMVKRWPRLGFICRRKGPRDRHFPPAVQVEVGTGFSHSRTPSAHVSEWPHAL